MEYTIFLQVETKSGNVQELSSTFATREIAIVKYKDAIHNMECFFAVNNTLYKLDGDVQIELISIPSQSPNWPSINIKSIKGSIKPGTSRKFEINHLPIIEKLS